MPLTCLNLFKKHARIDVEGIDEDEYLLHLLDAAELHVVRYTERPLEYFLDTYGGFPPPLTHAVMLIAAHWYNQRESVSGSAMHTVPETVEALIKPYTRLV